MRKIYIPLIICVLFIFAFYAFGLGAKDSPMHLLTHPLKSGEMAFESALKFLGNKNIIRLDSTSYTAIPTVISDTTAAFTRDVISRRPAWKILIPHAAIMAGMDSSNVNLGSEVDIAFEIVLDSLDGYCLLMRAVNLGKSNYEPSKHDTTLPFEFMEIEYRGFPDHYPSIGFCELIGKKESPNPVCP